MKETNFDVRTFYNGDDDEYNKPSGLTPEGSRLLTRLIALRGHKQLTEIRQWQPDAEGSEGITREWVEMPGVAKEYQSEEAGDHVKIGDLEALVVKAPGEGEDPTIFFVERDEYGGSEA